MARKVREKIGPSARIVGTDLNQSMIDTAKKLADPQSLSCEWQVANVEKLPFEDGSFSIAFCQQGIQFFPDRNAALCEIKRVLRDDGRLSLTVWNGISDFFKTLAESLQRHIGVEAANQGMTPFSFDGDSLPSLLTGSSTRVRPVSTAC